MAWSSLFLWGLPSSNKLSKSLIASSCCCRSVSALLVDAAESPAAAHRVILETMVIERYFEVYVGRVVVVGR